MPDPAVLRKTDTISTSSMAFAVRAVAFIGTAYLAAIVYLPSFYYHAGYFAALHLDQSLAPISLADVPIESYFAVVRTVGAAIAHPDWSRLWVLAWPEALAIITGFVLSCCFLYLSKRAKKRASDAYHRKLKQEIQAKPQRRWLNNILIIVAGTLGFPLAYPILLWLVAMAFVTLLALPLMFANSISSQGRQDAIAEFENIDDGTPVKLKKETGISKSLHVLVCVSEHCIVGDHTEVFVVARDAIETGERYIRPPDVVDNTGVVRA